MADKLFSHSALYLKYRPRYPEDLFSTLSRLAPSTHVALDVGTGNGQAALSLAKYFDQVIATDVNPKQIEQATPHERIEYKVVPAEEKILPESSVDLIIVAEALHWFDFERFNESVRFMLKPGGIYAAWGYDLPVIDESVDRMIRFYCDQVVGKYWASGRHHIETHYENIPFPFTQIPASELGGEFAMIGEWNLEDLLGYLDTWSATQLALKDMKKHPLRDDQELLKLFHDAWGYPDEFKTYRYPLFIKVARNYK